MFRSPPRLKNAAIRAPWPFVALLAVALLSCTSSETPDESTADGPTSVPQVEQPASEQRTINLGVAAGRRDGQPPIDALINTEHIIGRRFDTLRAYAFWDGEFPDLRHRWASDGGRLLHLSINARRTDGSVVPWQQIATATEGDPLYSELVGWIDRLARYDARCG